MGVFRWHLGGATGYPLDLSFWNPPPRSVKSKSKSSMVTLETSVWIAAADHEIPPFRARFEEATNPMGFFLISKAYKRWQFKGQLVEFNQVNWTFWAENLTGYVMNPSFNSQATSFNMLLHRVFSRVPEWTTETYKTLRSITSPRDAGSSPPKFANF